MSAAALDPSPRAILFGKLPSHGDFVHRGLDAAALAAWDSWASEAMFAAETQFGSRFDDAHDTAPPWCFISGPGPLGDFWRVGAFAPSADSAGRRYVIVVGIDNLSLADAVLLGPRAAVTLVEAVYRIFSENLGVDEAVKMFAPVASGAGGVQTKALELLLQTREAGVWWPYLDDSKGTEIRAGAAPASDLLLRGLSLLSGDQPP